MVYSWEEIISYAQALRLPTVYEVDKTYKDYERVVITCDQGETAATHVQKDKRTVYLTVIMMLIQRWSNESTFMVSYVPEGTDAMYYLGMNMEEKDPSIQAMLQVVDKAIEQSCDHATMIKHLNKVFPSQTDYNSILTHLINVRITIGEQENCVLPLHFNLHANQLTISAEKASFSLEAVKKMTEQFQQLVSQLTSMTVESNMYDMNMVTDEHTLPNPKADLPAEWRKSVVHHFEQNVTKAPKKAAVVDDRGTLSFEDLNQISNQLAHYLTNKGIGKGKVVGIFGHRSAAIIWGLLAILKTGASVCFLDAAYPSKRIINCVTVADANAIIHIQESGPLPTEIKQFLDTKVGDVISITHPHEALKSSSFSKESSKNLNVEIGPHDIAVLTFTSGSTGMPKAVLGRHGPLTHYYPWMAERFSLTSEDRFSMSSGIAHDPIQRDIFTPWYLGATIYIPSNQTIVNPGELASWFRNEKITITCLTPAMGQLLTTGAGVSGMKNETNVQLPDLRFAFFVGDVLTKKFVTRLRAIAADCGIINMYGSTETQRSVTYFLVPTQKEGFGRLKGILPIGVGMQGAQSLIFTMKASKPQLAGVGEIGEIYMRAHHLSAGYKGKPKVTAEKFIKNPFGGDDTDCLYRTGDIGTYLPNGDAVCLGRADDQIKIRGFRIELGEINTAITSHPTVKACVTIVRKDLRKDSDEKHIVAYPIFEQDAVSEGSSSHLIRNLKTYLKDRIPEYMIPTVIYPLEAFPLTPNGKIKRNELPHPGSDTVDEDTFVAPRNNTERQLAALWKSVLGVSQIGVHDDFFDLGGHSLTASMLVFRVKQEVKGASDLPVSALYEAPNIAAMAAVIDSSGMGEKIDKRKTNARLYADTILPPELKPQCDLPKEQTFEAHWENPKHVMITGATGFLGSFLLGDLIKTTSADTHIYVLVRAKDEEQAWNRVEESLRVRLLMILDEETRNRLHLLVGDLKKPLLGLSQASFDHLANTLDVIIHNGAQVHWFFPYEQLKAANVTGTIEILKLGFFGSKITPIHYVSTTSVFDSPQYVKMSDIYEDSDLPFYELLNGGYAQSKYVAEKLCMNARKRGLPTCIYRPGYITGHSRTGIWNPDDFLCRMIKGCIQLGSYPWLNDKLDMSPVDFVSGAITYLFRKPCSLMEHKAYHIVNPNEFHFHELFRAGTRLGFRVSELPLEDWLETLKDAYTNDGLSDLSDDEARKDANPLYPLITYFSGPNWSDNEKKKRPWYDNTNTLEGLEKSDIKCPPVIELMGTYYKFLCLCGFLREPKRPSRWAQRKLGFGEKRKLSIKLRAGKIDDPQVSPQTYEFLMRNNRT